MLLPSLLACLAFAQAPLPTVYVIGDSTASNTENRGWGDHLAPYFDSSRIHVVNRARAGRSSRTFQTEGLWDKVLADLQPGDYVLIQFGHNDGGPPDKDRARGSLPGLGDESEEFTMPDGHTELVHTFAWYMRKFIADTQAKGAHPMVLSLTVRNIWKDGSVERGPGLYSQWSRQIAKTAGVPLLDVNNVVATRYDKLGELQVKELFSTDHTHTSPAGAGINALAVVAEIKRVDNQLAEFLAPRPTLWLIGDSTVRNGQGDGSNGQWGWGDLLAPYFDVRKIDVVNRAVGGLSSRTFLAQGHWDRVLAALKPGDFVIMQFGHNDSGPLDDAARARGTIRGISEETREIDNPITKRHEVVHTYGWYLRKYIADTRAKGATPIVCSLIPRKIWKDGHIARNKEDYAGWAEEVAAAEQVPFVDLNERIARRYDALGPEKVDLLFGDPHTHTSRAGAALNAEIVAETLKSMPDLMNLSKSAALN